jgi:hypothetical protein
MPEEGNGGLIVHRWRKLIIPPLARAQTSGDQKIVGRITENGAMLIFHLVRKLDLHWPGLRDMEAFIRAGMLD